MEILFSQRHNLASIIPMKDYCRLDEKKSTRNTFDIEALNDDPFDNITQFISQNVISLPAKLNKGKRRIYYYYGSEFVGEQISLYSPKPNNQTFYTNKDRHIRAHYGNPYSNIEIDTYERSITSKGDRITIKKYHHIKTRKINSIYFKKRTVVYSLTLDLKTGNFITVITSKTGRNTGKQFRTNSFQSLEVVLNQIMSSEYVKNGHSIFSGEENSAYMGEVARLLNLKGVTLYNSIIVKFVELKKIKVPNDYFGLLTTHYPTEKFLKKNDRKLVASVLDAIGIKSKITIKMLHDNVDIDLGSLYWICGLLGDEYPKFLNNINSSLFIKPKSGMTPYIGIHYARMREKIKPLNGKDRETLCFILNDFVENANEYEKKDGNYVSLIDDHVSMMEKIRPYDSNIRINARTWKDFNLEHREFTKIIAMIKKGWVTEYVFNDKMVNEIEKPITIELNVGDETTPQIVTETFYPYILKREEEYSEEGTFMHHCVATYSDKDKSIIVSVRTKDGNDRVTCEFTTQTGQMVQARHFCNRQPPEDIMLAIDQLKVKTLKYARLGLLNCLEKKKTQVKINGIEVPKPPSIPTLNEHLFNYEVPF
jgi:hypothetical protein